MNDHDLNSLHTASNKSVLHDGVVTKITDDIITISLKGNINCEGCKAKMACGVSESTDKEIEVINNFSKIQLNENVEVALNKSLGLRAVFFAYVLPFILLLSVLLISSNFVKEWLAGILSILVLIPYYTIIYLMKNSFKETFKFSILKTT
ncbi:MAG: SoxR reducing system RseC family protein [Flavobacteriaceae bacterium]|nr:SoxR reducing system RseC family protein [Flavobacteriaceae bacterium]